MKHLMSLAGLSVAGLMLVSCNTQVKEANYQVIPLPQEISVMEQAAPFILSDGTKIMYPEGNERMQKNAEFLASYIKDLTGKPVRKAREFFCNWGEVRKILKVIN